MEGADTFAGRVGGDAVEIANVVMSSVAECERKDIPVTADALALWLTCKPGTPGTVILTTSGQYVTICIAMCFLQVKSGLTCAYVRSPLVNTLSESPLSPW